jgi:hypothetical protein
MNGRTHNGPAGSSGPRGSRLPLVLVMLTGVLMAGVLRNRAMAYQYSHSGVAQLGVRNTSALGSMNSFALALLLGGLRGPLAMVLWATSEAQKADRNLEDFDTKVEWIRLLQPEFDTVHIFQIWNKAYNISVQMASLPNRYSAILDALHYAAQVDQSRPANINIMNAIAQVYSNKLGTVHAEKAYYRKWVREQSFAPEGWKGPEQERNRVGWQPRRLSPKVDASGNLLPEQLAPRFPRPADLPAGADWNNGAELQYLEKYQPFPQGVSTFALAYNYAKRAQVLMTAGKQKPLQLSEGVIDSRPALELKAWAEEEWERGRTFEHQAYGVQLPAERFPMELTTAGYPANTQAMKDASVVDEAAYCYGTAARLARDASAEYRRHIADPNYFDRITTYASHIDVVEAMAHLNAADRDYILAAAAPAGEEREKLLRSAAAAYQDAIGVYQLIVLKYYVSDQAVETVYPKGTNRTNVAQLPRAQQDELMRKLREFVRQRGADEHNEDMQEYETHIARCTARLGQMLRQ